MGSKASQFAKDVLVEIAWLLGSWAISFGLLGWAIGFNQMGARQLDIQLHNTYFVLPPWALGLPIFAFFATILTSVRAFKTRFRQRATLVVLLLLGMLSILLASWVGWMLKSLR